MLLKRLALGALLLCLVAGPAAAMQPGAVHANHSELVHAMRRVFADMNSQRHLQAAPPTPAWVTTLEGWGSLVSPSATLASNYLNYHFMYQFSACYRRIAESKGGNRPCDSGFAYNGISLCREECGGLWPFTCGAMCTFNQAACVDAVWGQVSSIIGAVIAIVLRVRAMPNGTPSKTVMAGSTGDAIATATAKLTKPGLKMALKFKMDAGKKAVQRFFDGATDHYFSSLGMNVLGAIGGDFAGVLYRRYSGSTPPSDITIAKTALEVVSLVDPTGVISGILGIITSFMKPQCTEMAHETFNQVVDASFTFRAQYGDDVERPADWIDIYDFPSEGSIWIGPPECLGRGIDSNEDLTLREVYSYSTRYRLFSDVECAELGGTYNSKEQSCDRPNWAQENSIQGSWSAICLGAPNSSQTGRWPKRPPKGKCTPNTQDAAYLEQKRKWQNFEGEYATYREKDWAPEFKSMEAWDRPDSSICTGFVEHTPRMNEICVEQARILGRGWPEDYKDTGGRYPKNRDSHCFWREDYDFSRQQGWLCGRDASSFVKSQAEYKLAEPQPSYTCTIEERIPLLTPADDICNGLGFDTVAELYNGIWYPGQRVLSEAECRQLNGAWDIMSCFIKRLSDEDIEAKRQTDPNLPLIKYAYGKWEHACFGADPIPMVKERGDNEPMPSQCSGVGTDGTGSAVGWRVLTEADCTALGGFKTSYNSVRDDHRLRYSVPVMQGTREWFCAVSSNPQTSRSYDRLCFGAPISMRGPTGGGGGSALSGGGATAPELVPQIPLSDLCSTRGRTIEALSWRPFWLSCSRDGFGSAAECFAERQPEFGICTPSRIYMTEFEKHVEDSMPITINPTSVSILCNSNNENAYPALCRQCQPSTPFCSATPAFLIQGTLIMGTAPYGLGLKTGWDFDALKTLGGSKPCNSDNRIRLFTQQECSEMPGGTWSPYNLKKPDANRVEGTCQGTNFDYSKACLLY